MQPEPPWYLLPAILVGFPLVFVTIWSVVCLLLSMMSGWRGMAARYPCPANFQGTPLGSGFAMRVGFVSYRGIVSFSSSPQGLCAEVLRIFPFHGPLLLPWGALSLKRGGGPFSAGEMQVQGGSTFHLNEEALRSIEQAMGTHARSGARL